MLSYQMRRSLVRALALCAIVCGVIIGTLALAAPVYAQDSGTDTASQPPAGVGILILFMGIVALVAVGGYYYTQNRAVQHPVEDEIEE
jgi:hypothetical protein